MWGVGRSDSVVCTLQPGWLMFSLIFNNHLTLLNTNKVLQSAQLFNIYFQCNIFQFNEPSSGISLQKGLKNKYICIVPCQFSAVSLVYKYLLE